MLKMDNDKKDITLSNLYLTVTEINKPSLKSLGHF